MSDEKPEVKKKSDDELTLLEVLAVGLHGLTEDLGMLRDDHAHATWNTSLPHGQDSWSSSSIRFRKLLEDRGIL